MFDELPRHLIDGLLWWLAKKLKLDDAFFRRWGIAFVLAISLLLPALVFVYAESTDYGTFAVILIIATCLLLAYSLMAVAVHFWKPRR